MNQAVIKKTSELSDEEMITFPELVFKLSDEGVETYYADLMSSSKTYYSDSESYTLASRKVETSISDTFNAEKIIAAIRASQSGQIKYQEFIKQICEAGVFSYFVFIKGRKAIYFGKKGEQHIESFPQK